MEDTGSAPLNNPERARLGKALRAASLWAIALFFGINAALAYAKPRTLKGDHFGMGATPIAFQAIDSAIETFHKRTGAPPVVLMGSSLVMAPVWSVDTTTRAGVENCFLHHKSLRLSDLLSAKKGEKVDVVSFGLPGAVVSDMYLIADKLFRGKDLPQVIVYGLAPRDFMDDLLASDTQTPVFRRLMALDDLPRLSHLYMSTFEEKAEFSLNQVVFMYGRRQRYQDKVGATLAKTYNKILPGTAVGQATPVAENEQGFLLNGDRASVWRKSIGEYRKRYRRFNAQQFEKQKQFLKALLDIGRRRGCPVVLVNMPLTADNLALMPKGFYATYKQTLENMANEYACPLVDLQSDPSYHDADFYDTVHLNAAGGDKFLRKLAQWISEHGDNQVAQRQGAL